MGKSLGGKLAELSGLKGWNWARLAQGKPRPLPTRPLLPTPGHGHAIHSYMIIVVQKFEKNKRKKKKRLVLNIIHHIFIGL